MSRVFFCGERESFCVRGKRKECERKFRHLALPPPPPPPLSLGTDKNRVFLCRPSSPSFPSLVSPSSYLLGEARSVEDLLHEGERDLVEVALFFFFFGGGWEFFFFFFFSGEFFFPDFHPTSRSCPPLLGSSAL